MPTIIECFYKSQNQFANCKFIVIHAFVALWIRLSNELVSNLPQMNHCSLVKFTLVKPTWYEVEFHFEKYETVFEWNAHFIYWCWCIFKLITGFDWKWFEIDLEIKSESKMDSIYRICNWYECQWKCGENIIPLALSAAVIAIVRNN